MFDGVPEHVALVAECTFLIPLPGATPIHDLQVWAKSTNQLALTVHLVVPTDHRDDALLMGASRRLRHNVDITHVTLPVAAAAPTQACHACWSDRERDHDHGPA